MLYSEPYFSPGANLDQNGCGFSLHAPYQHAVSLAIFGNDGNVKHIEMQETQMGHWYTYVPGIEAGTEYAFMISYEGEQWYVADPYARAVSKQPPYQPPYSADQSVNLARCVVTDSRFDWQGVSQPRIPETETLIFETHVKGLTQLNTDVPENERGRYLGLVSPAMLAFYKRQGIRCLQLLPITSALSEPHLLTGGRNNYWGYNPFVFTAPNPRYAEKDAVTELKTAIRELHRNGIEVILDVVFNHTAESGEGGPVLHYKALDKAMYLQDDKGNYLNYTGCGNTLDLTYPAALKTVMDTLRMWVTDYQVDGFRFDLAVTLGRNGQSFSPRSAFFQAVAQDPVLRSVKLIAEPWDIGPNGYQLGNFPTNWHECNDKIRDTTRSLWRGDEGMLRRFTKRLMGSRELFSGAHWPSHLSVNYVTYHDGFTLEDLVSYEQRHNHANGENNRDGHGDNRSANYGVEGATDDPAIVAKRERQKRNMVASILFSFGMPHLLTADMLSHSQQGNNNAYCQDNEISWLDWTSSDRKLAFADWVSEMISRRQEIMPAFIRAYSGRHRHENHALWTHPNGTPIELVAWHSIRQLRLQLTIGKHSEHKGTSLIYCLNVSEETCEFSLPESSSWQCICDTSMPAPETETTGESTVLQPYTLKIFTCR
ncbi:glycogen debranching protein GlgX [Enterovibrio paralichthyis]|uniref:glycogen debranching protein GlgX n=1 Tax=Enterovibrio paralichthyis TaxID=2853805 RepID=UPI001C491B62|nr:glycogen debranching protein GlgX [Enterovibrio paralichthyis]MBV7297119.1 glycogen debranching protein GlgX [Enterovibrio paralichthyis]